MSSSTPLQYDFSHKRSMSSPKLTITRLGIDFLNSAIKERQNKKAEEQMLREEAEEERNLPDLSTVGSLLIRGSMLG